MTAPPAQAAFLRHARLCPYGLELTRCQVCFDLDRDASAEADRRAQRLLVGAPS